MYYWKWSDRRDRKEIKKKKKLASAHLKVGQWETHSKCTARANSDLHVDVFTYKHHMCGSINKFYSDTHVKSSLQNDKNSCPRLEDSLIAC